MGPAQQRLHRLHMLEANLMGAGGGSHGLEQHPVKDRGRHLGEAPRVNLEAGFGLDRQCAEPLVAQLVEPLPIFADQGRGPGDSRPSRTASRTVQFRKDSVANPVARVVEVLVALILDPLLALGGQVRPESDIGPSTTAVSAAAPGESMIWMSPVRCAAGVMAML